MPVQGGLFFISQPSTFTTQHSVCEILIVLKKSNKSQNYISSVIQKKESKNVRNSELQMGLHQTSDVNIGHMGHLYALKTNDIIETVQPVHQTVHFEVKQVLSKAKQINERER